MPAVIRVVTVDRFPPLILPDTRGELIGALPDLWKLWSTRTGIKVELRGMDWPSAMEEIRASRADVITPMMRTPEREAEFDFSPAFYGMPVRLYFHDSISGIVDASSSKGFTIGVGSADPCGKHLRDAGSDHLETYLRHEDMMAAASRSEIKVFCGGELQTNYYLNRYGLAGQFRHSPPLYHAEGRWAVRKGDQALYHLVNAGFDRISTTDRQHILEHWMGAYIEPQPMPPYLRYAGSGLLALLGVAALLLGWNTALRRRVAQKVAVLARQQASLEESEERFRRLFEQSRHPALLMEGERFIAANQASLDMMRAPTLTDFLHLTAADISPPCQPDGRSSAEKTAEMIRIAHEQGCHDFEWEYLRIDGEPFTAQIQLTPLRHRGRDLLYVLWRDISAQKRTERELATARETAIRLEQQQRLSILLEQDIVGVAQTDGQGRYTLVNDRYCSILGRERNSLLGQRAVDVTKEENREFMKKLHQRVLQEKRHFAVENCFRRIDGQAYCLQLAVTVHRDADDKIDSYMLLALDITERQQQEKVWRQTAEILTVAERAAGAGAWRWDCIHDQAEWSPQMFRLLGLDPTRYPANFASWTATIHPLDREMTMARMQAYQERADSFIDSYRVLHPDGRVIWIDCHGKVVKRDEQGRASEMAGVCLDVTAKKEAERQILQLNTELEAKVEARTAELLSANEELRHLARRDALTGLPNRLAANERRHLQFVALQRSGQPYSVLLIDIDHFKRVNDSFGHAVGDRVLQQVGETLQQSLRERDFVARWGGEEFLVLLPGTGLGAAKLVAEKLRQAVASCPDPDAGTITISLGLALATIDKPDEDMPLREADACLYAAKREGRNRLVVHMEGLSQPALSIPPPMLQ